MAAFADLDVRKTAVTYDSLLRMQFFRRAYQTTPDGDTPEETPADAMILPPMSEELRMELERWTAKRIQSKRAKHYTRLLEEHA